MIIQFNTLFEVAVSHDYHGSGLNEDFDIGPTDLCSSKLRNHALLFRKTRKGFSILYESLIDDQGISQTLKTIEDSVRFSFVMRSRNPYLINYSDLPLENRPGGIYLMHNQNKDESGSEILLTADTNTSYMSQKDIAELRPQFFQYAFESGGASAEITIHDDADRQITKETVAVVDGACNYAVNLRGRSPGKYTLHIDGAKKLEFYACDELVGRDVFGLIDITITNMNKKKFKVQINNRKTCWKYYMVLKYRLREYKPEDWPADWEEKWPGERPAGWPGDWPDDWKITYPESPGSTIDILPKAEDLTVNPDGTISIPFISGVELPLKEKAVEGIMLKKTGSSVSGIKEIENLPVPSFTSLKPPEAGSSDTKIYSEVYVYI
jgi:hypothetical protein